MLFARNNRYLSFYDAGKYPSGLGTIDENLLAITENSDKSPPDLSLVWQQEETLAKRNRGNIPTVSVPAPIQKQGWWKRFKNPAERIGTLVALFASPNPSSPKKLFVSYTFKGEGNGRFSLRSQLQIVEAGRVLETLKDSTKEHVLPSREGEPEQYCISFVNPEFQYATSPLCIEVVLLERVGPENLIYASAAKPGKDLKGSKGS